MTTRAESTTSMSDRLSGRVRWIAVRGIASTVAGVLVLGVGGRLVMLGSRLLHPDAIGRLTENGNRIGEFTVDGTLALVLFGGLGSGLFAGVVWALTKEWIPDKAYLVGVGAVAIGGFALVAANNRDFVILVNPTLDLVLLLGLLFVFGFTLHRVDGFLERRLPSGGGTGSTVAYSLLAALGAPFILLAFGSFFTGDFCGCEPPPVWTGVFMVAAGAATITWWLLDLRGTTTKPAALERFGFGAVAAASLAGGVHLAGQIFEIL